MLIEEFYFILPVTRLQLFPRTARRFFFGRIPRCKICCDGIAIVLAFLRSSCYDHDKTTNHDICIYLYW